MLVVLGVMMVLSARPAVAQQPSVAAIVEQFYPTSLTAFPDEIGGRQQCFAVYETDASAAPQIIVAAFTNHTEAALRNPRAGSGGFHVAAETPAGLDLSGVRCEVVLEDVDADGLRDIRVDFSVNRAIVSWLFRWTEPDPHIRAMTLTDDRPSLGISRRQNRRLKISARQNA